MSEDVSTHDAVFFSPRIFLVKHVHQPRVDLSPSALEKATSSIVSVLTVIDYKVYTYLLIG